MIHRRYSSFEKLRAQLVESQPVVALPPLPPKHVPVWLKYAPGHLEKRRRGLQRWLNALFMDVRWAGHPALRAWVLER